MALHGWVSTMSCACMNIDAQKICGIAETDLDNGTFVALGDMALNDDAPGGFEYHVETAGNASYHVWLVRTPEVGDDIEMQMSNDPRSFYNKAGKPLSLCYMNAGYDHIEMTAESFEGGELPEVDDMLIIGENGKLEVDNEADQDVAQVVFYCVALHQISIGAESVPTAILFCEKNG